VREWPSTIGGGPSSNRLRKSAGEADPSYKVNSTRPHPPNRKWGYPGTSRQKNLRMIEKSGHRIGFRHRFSIGLEKGEGRLPRHLSKMGVTWARGDTESGWESRQARRSVRGATSFPPGSVCRGKRSVQEASGGRLRAILEEPGEKRDAGYF